MSPGLRIMSCDIGVYGRILLKSNPHITPNRSLLVPNLFILVPNLNLIIPSHTLILPYSRKASFLSTTSPNTSKTMD